MRLAVFNISLGYGFLSMCRTGLQKTPVTHWLSWHHDTDQCAGPEMLPHNECVLWCLAPELCKHWKKNNAKFYRAGITGGKILPSSSCIRFEIEHYVLINVRTNGSSWKCSIQIINLPFFPFLMRIVHNAIYWKFHACRAQICIRNTKQVYLQRLKFEKKKKLM